MIFSEREIDLLRLVYWCQYIRPEDLIDLFPDAEVDTLTRLNYVAVHQNSGALVVTNRGRDFLASVFQNGIPDLRRSFHREEITRRLRCSHLVLTAYRAGVDTFTASMSCLDQSPSLFLPIITRGRGTNPWGSTRVAALLRLGDQLLAAHHIARGIGRLALLDELTAFNNQTSRIRGVSRGFLFTGASYHAILEELDSPQANGDSKLTGYGDAWHRLHYPVYLLSSDATGVTQLQIMAIPGYRRRLTLAALRAHYAPPPEDVPEWDAIMDGLPFVMAVDMDLRRIDAAIDRAQAHGIEKIAVAGLESQADQVLYARYRETGKARVFILPGETLEQAIGGPLKPYAPGRAQYVTEKGDVVDAPLIQAGRKTGRSR